jgi:mevalonate pyrophosphate decarboxylase
VGISFVQFIFKHKVHYKKLFQYYFKMQDYKNLLLCFGAADTSAAAAAAAAAAVGTGAEGRRE